MHSSVSYSELDCEETPHSRRTSVSSIQFFPSGGFKRSVFVFAFLAGTTITFFYMRHPTYDVGDYMKNWTLENSSKETNEDVLRDLLFRNESSKPSWTWTCEKTKKYSSCVRIMSSETSPLQSLKTCNMLCSAKPIWPLPTGPKSFGKIVVPVKVQSLALKIIKSPSTEVSQYLQEAFKFMTIDIDTHAPTKQNKDALSLEVRVTVEGDADPRLRLDTKENYNLKITKERKILVVNITAQSFCGARHGFETLSQLIWYDDYLESLVALESANVKDAPKFMYRGLLLDTARQYFPVEDILRTIDAMAASKLNTFHWHATDSQSFPLKLDSVPQMAIYGAYSLKQVYTAEDIRNIVHRATVRGIRVVIEIDAPAHVGRAWSWGNSSGLNDLAYCVELDPWKGYCGEPPCAQLNPTNDHVFEILEKIYKEIIELTGVHDVFHLGGDEVNRACWEKNMKGSFIIDTWYSFTQKSLVALQNANKGKLPNMTIIWSSKLTSESLLNRMKNYTIQLWGPSSWPEVVSIPQAGIRSLISNVDAWYLDCGFGQWLEAGACQPYRLWQTVYDHRPWENHGWNVAGGTACMWTEQLAPEAVDARIWPRAAAVAERLWADPPNKATADDHLRIDMQRQRLVQRGIRADVIWPRWCTENPYKCYSGT